jgi:LuxR family maltose regulon positive regulatory protein
MRGDLAQAHRVVYEALQQKESSIANYKCTLLAALCFTNWIAADLNSLQQTSSQYLKHAQQHNLLESIAVGNYFAGIVHYERNELDLAESALAPVVNQNFIPSVINYTHSAFALSLIYQAQGLANKATKIIESATDYMLEIGNTTLLEICKAFQAELALRQGRIAEADFWAQNYNLVQLIPAARFYTPQLTLARILLAKGTADSQKKAHKLLSRLHDFFISIHSTNVLIDILILQALLHDARGDESKAAKKLMEAITLAEPGRFIRPFLDVGPKMADLLYHLVKQDPDQKYAKQILGAFSNEETGMGLDASEGLNGHRSSLSNQALVGPLTNREIEILSILAKGLSNNKIADRLFISPETVKRHLYNIYQKFNVKNRHEAIVKAKSLGIL